MQELLDFCRTPRQKEILDAVIECGSNRKAAVRIGISPASVDEAINRIKKYAATVGHSPIHDMVHTVPDGYKVKGVSTLYNSEGVIRQQWVKSAADEGRRYQMMVDAIDGLVSEYPKLDPVEYEGSVASDRLMAIYPLGDPHVGLRSWGAETGHDWDLTIAQRTFRRVFNRLVLTAPSCKTAVIGNLGDFFHADNMSGVTERSGHHLDLDGRYAKMISVGMTIIRQMIDSALRHHEKVIVINSTGNHDDTGSLFLNVALSHIYENEKRINIQMDPTPFHYVRHGKCLVGFHHGHSCKADKLPLVMATDKSTDWGETEFRYWMTGHIHHDTVKEYPGVKVESFRTLTAKDAYATWNGYRSGQDSKCIVLDSEFGEVERHTINIAMVR
jgi:hypothetical protein